MIRKVIINNFKSIEKQTYEFKLFDLIVGGNNSGKSTVLQALAVWQYCIDEFDKAKRKKRGVGVVLPNFTALPVPEFKLLWRHKTTQKDQDKVFIDIEVHWEKNGSPYDFKVQLYYHSSQMVYASPVGELETLNELRAKELLPRIAFVPPFSGLETSEERRTDAPVRKQVGKAQPGSVLRNLLLRVWENDEANKTKDWETICKIVKDWFSVDLLHPQYDMVNSTQIRCEYCEERGKIKKNYDIIAGGSGFHQTLTLLAFLFGYHPDTILLDEPDAHLHVNLQREIIKYFKHQSLDRGIQFIIATHAEALIGEVEPDNILSLLARSPKRILDKKRVFEAMAAVKNVDATIIAMTKAVLYVEGENDARILGMWEGKLSYDLLRKVHICYMRGGSKEEMIGFSDNHFKAVKEIVPEAKRLVLVDHDGKPHFTLDNSSVYEWKRKNIENYLLVQPAWKRALYTTTGLPEDLLSQPIMRPAMEIIDRFFEREGIMLPRGENWKRLSTNVFRAGDGKKILFENQKGNKDEEEEDSLFHQLRAANKKLELKQDVIAASMLPEEIHEDVENFFKKLSLIIEQ